MRCKLDQNLSELRAFATDEEHCYLRAVFVPVKLSLLETLNLGNQAQYTLNIYPRRDNDGNIDEAQMDALVAAFKNGDLAKETYYVDRVPVEVEPFVMKRSRDSQFGKKGDFIMDGNNVRVYNTIAITCFHQLIDDKEVPMIDENGLKTRALAIKNFRIKNGDWMDLTKYIAENENPETQQDETPTDEGFDEAQQKQETKTTNNNENTQAKPRRF